MHLQVRDRPAPPGRARQAGRVLEFIRQHPAISQDDIASALGIGHTTVSRCIRALIVGGRLTRRQVGSGNRRPSIYTVHDDAEVPSP
jgi:DNA-binding MarR family transcriptional regulator